MAVSQEKKYFIRISDELIEVNEEIYRDYHRIERHMQTLDEKDLRNGKVSFSELDTNETLGEEMLPDTSMPIEELVIVKSYIPCLHSQHFVV